MRGGRPLHADVYRSAASGPVIVWIHGGALIVGDRSDVVLAEGKLLARYLEAGCTVVSIDYRLAPETLLAGIVDDVAEACDWTRGRFGDDLVVAGQSAGGYLALMAGLRVRPRAVAALYGYGDIVGSWYTKPHYTQLPAVSEDQARSSLSDPAKRGAFYLWCRQSGRWPQEVSGHDPVTEAEWFRSYCPLQQVTSGTPPTILVHGTADDDVPCEQSTLMAAAMADAGVDHELVTIDGGGHAFDLVAPDARTTRDAYDRIIRFISR
jgi:acetyl esterase/lipase